MSGHAFRIECCSSVFGCMKRSIIINLESIEMLSLATHSRPRLIATLFQKK